MKTKVFFIFLLASALLSCAHEEVSLIMLDNSEVVHNVHNKIGASNGDTVFYKMTHQSDGIGMNSYYFYNMISVSGWEEELANPDKTYAVYRFDELMPRSGSHKILETSARKAVVSLIK